MAESATVLVPSERTADRLNAATPEIRTVDFAFISPWKLVLVRTARTYLQGFVAAVPMVPIGVGTGVLNLTETWQIIVAALVIPVLPAVVAFAQNSAEVLAKWDEQHPDRRG